jgi:hypothetical protein
MIYLVMYTIPYEGDQPVAAFSTLEAAEDHLKRLAGKYGSYRIQELNLD